MTAWRDIASTEDDPESPLTTSLAVAWTNNVIAHMEGDSSVPAALVGHHLKSIQVFTSSGTWNRPTNVNFIKVITVGGGGGGGAPAAIANRVSRGGGGASYSEIFIDVSAIPSVTVTIGAGGSGGSAGNFGGNGGVSTFGSHTNCDGGDGGSSLEGAGEPGGVIPTLGYLKIAGENSADTNFGVSQGAHGGGTPFGSGAYSGANLAGNAAENFGTGGSGVIKTSAAGLSGGSGKAGVIIVEEYS